MVIKWRCSQCGALHDGQTALTIMLSKSFVPVEVQEPKIEEKPRREEPRPVYKPASRKAEPKEEEMEYEDLKLD